MKHIMSTCLLGVLALTACEGTKKQFDFTKKSPDEFAVVKRAPLEMPPNLNELPSQVTLPAPKPGAARPQEPSAQAQAKASLIGADPRVIQHQSATQSASENALLQKAGAVNADPNIRTTIEKETAELAAEQTPAVDRILKITGKKIDAPAVEVDPTAETNRIKANKAAGKPITEGETAIKEE